MLEFSLVQERVRNFDPESRAYSERKQESNSSWDTEKDFLSSPAFHSLELRYLQTSPPTDSTFCAITLAFHKLLEAEHSLPQHTPLFRKQRDRCRTTCKLRLRLRIQFQRTMWEGESSDILPIIKITFSRFLSFSSPHFFFSFRLPSLSCRILVSSLALTAVLQSLY